MEIEDVLAYIDGQLRQAGPIGETVRRMVSTRLQEDGTTQDLDPVKRLRAYIDTLELVVVHLPACFEATRRTLVHEFGVERVAFDFGAQHSPELERDNLWEVPAGLTEFADNMQRQIAILRSILPFEVV